eukprot:2845490-Rhodomonas_salina.1
MGGWVVEADCCPQNDGYCRRAGAGLNVFMHAFCPRENTVEKGERLSAEVQYGATGGAVLRAGMVLPARSQRRR